MADQQTEQNLRYELKINGMQLIVLEKQTLIQCIASILGIEGSKLHEIIVTNLKKSLESSQLPRKLLFIRKDMSIFDDYKKYPELKHFIKITLEMVSQIYQTKITLFSLNSQSLLTGLIVNEKGYQEEIKVARIDNNFYEIKDNYYSHHSSARHEPSSSSHSYKVYEAFDMTHLGKKFQMTISQPTLTKSYSHIVGSPIVKKNISLCEDPSITPRIAQQPKNISPIVIPALNPLQLNKQLDQVSIDNAQDHEADQYSNVSQLSQSIKFGQQDLTQSLTIEQGNIQPAGGEEPGLMGGQQQAENGVFYGYYSHHMYYPPYMVGQNPPRSETYNNNYNNLSSSVSVSPGKNILKKQASTLQINQNERYTGRLKFFDEGKNYGFIIMDADESDIFVHCDDLQKAGITKQRVRSYKQSEGMIRFSYKVMSYFGKYRESRKAVDLIILDDGLGMPSLYT